MDLTITSAAHHRNGIDGEEFWVVLFEDAAHGRMVATLFRDPAQTAVYNIDALVAGNIGFGSGNSWRGDQYRAVLWPLLVALVVTEGGWMPFGDK